MRKSVTWAWRFRRQSLHATTSHRPAEHQAAPTVWLAIDRRVQDKIDPAEHSVSRSLRPHQMRHAGVSRGKPRMRHA